MQGPGRAWTETPLPRLFRYTTTRRARQRPTGSVRIPAVLSTLSCRGLLSGPCGVSETYRSRLDQARMDRGNVQPSTCQTLGR